MPTYTRFITDGTESATDIRRLIKNAVTTWTPQGSRISDCDITQWTHVNTHRGPFEIATLNGVLQVTEEALGTVYVHFDISHTMLLAEPEKGCVVSLLYRAHHSNPASPWTDAIARPYHINGIVRQWRGVIESFTWTMSDYIEALSDPDSREMLEELASRQT